MRAKRTLLLFALLIGLAALWWFSTPTPIEKDDASPKAHRALTVSRLANDHERFVGSAVCADCHADIAARYAHSGMARSWRKLDGKTPWPIDAPFEDPRSGFRYRVLAEEGRIFQEETALEPGSPHRLRVEAHYTIGSGNHAQAMATDRDGYVHLLPLAWFTDEKRWRLNPGYEGFNRRFARPIVPGCVACHGEVARHDPPTSNRYHGPLADGISCERCHGPGKDHVDHWNGLTIADLPEKTIVNPARLSPERGNGVCFQCHVQGDVTVYQPGSGPFGFRPGDRLSDHRLDFLAMTDRPEAFGIASHGARLMRSACFTKSGKLTCFHCHDPHEAIRKVDKASFDRHCLDCHQPASCGRPIPAAEKTDRGCVGCHMPRRPTRESQHVIFTDHWIRKKPPAESGKPETLAPNADVEVLPLWPEADPHGLRLGCAHVALHENHGPQEKALRRGLGLLEEARRAGHADEESDFCLASALLSQQRGNEAVALLQSLLVDRPDHVAARFRLGLAFDQLGNYDLAIREYEGVIEAAPAWMEPYPLLARLYLGLEQPRQAVDLLDRQLKYNPDAAAFTQLALARHRIDGPADECLELLDRAIELDPRLAMPHLQQARIHAALGRAGRAIASYRKALEIEPENALARRELETLLAR